MGKRIQWEKPHRELGGLTPTQWLEARYPTEPDTPGLARELAELLALDFNPYRTINKQATMQGIKKSPETLAAIARQRKRGWAAPESPYLHIFEDWPTAEYDPFIVASDWHVPYYNRELAEKMMLVARHWKPEPIKNLVIGGDFIDYSQLGIFLEEPEQPRRTLEDDMEFTTEVLEWLTEWFANILILQANHELRFSKALGNQISHDRWGKLYEAGLNQVHFSKWSWCVITDKLGKQWRITHPGRRWKNLGRLAQELANRYQMHIMLCHSHVSSLTYNISGDYICIDTGGMFAEQAMGYYMKQDAAYWRWCPAFWVVSNGKAHGFSEVWTDWEWYWQMLGIE